MSEKLGPDATRLGPNFLKALAWVSDLHGEQARKGKPDVPYVSHLIAVASLVLEDGGTEDEAIAALLHDAVEDQGTRPAELAEQFGETVARIVEHCTDDLENDRLEGTKSRGADNWKARKEAYLARLEHADAASLRVSAADKLHNARAIVADLRRQGRSALDVFNAPPSEVVWYYRSLDAVFARRLPGLLSSELTAAVRELVDLAGP